MMDQKRLAAFMAGQTAVISEICELLIAKGVVSRIEIRDALYDLLRDRAIMNSDPMSEAPIKHLISVIESVDPEN